MASKPRAESFGEGWVAVRLERLPYEVPRRTMVVRAWRPGDVGSSGPRTAFVVRGGGALRACGARAGRGEVLLSMREWLRRSCRESYSKHRTVCRVCVCWGARGISRQGLGALGTGTWILEKWSFLPS